LSEQWVHSGVSSPKVVEWVSLDTNVSGDIEGFDIPSELKSGLDTNAEGMHRRFLSDLGSTSDVYKDHRSFIKELSLTVNGFSEIGEGPISMEELIEDLDGAMVDGELCLNLPLMKENITVQTKDGGGGFNLARLTFSDFPSRGIGPFRLPQGKRVSMAYWEGDLLRMKIE